MCDPVTIGTVALSAGTTLYGANQSAKLQSRQMSAQYGQQKQFNEQLQAGTVQNMNQLSTQQVQTQEAASRQDFDQQIQAQKLMARAKLAGGEAGVTGASLSAVMNDVAAAAGRNRSRIAGDAQDRIEQSQRQKEAVKLKADMQVNDDEIIAPSGSDLMVAAGLESLAIGMRGYGDYKKRKVG